MGVLVLAVWAKAETGFVRTLPAEDFATAGLQKLTPEELARLEALVQRYKAGVVVEVRQQAEAVASASRHESEQKIAAAETKAREAEAKANEAEAKAKKAETKVAAAPAKKQPGWFAALVTLNRAAEKPDKEAPLESRLVGNFTGWSGHTIFNLEDGTQWVQQNKTDAYSYSPALHTPTVKISPASLSGFWLEVKGVNNRVRVIPLTLPESK